MSEIIVDSFAGGGGASEGIEIALGRSPDVAINHDAEAMAMHRANHPGTQHVPHNVWKVDPIEVTAGRPVGLLWTSPDCKHFSKAKGGKPVQRNIRDLAWVVVRWAKQVRPRIVILENVEEFRDWGPVDLDGRPCPDRKGQTFRQWIGELRRLGYRVEHRELRACDYGAPTIRKRLFLIARRDGRPIAWPAPTHGPADSPQVKAGRLKPYRTAAEIIDWSLPCHSIFLTREEGRLVGVNRPLADKTMARIAKGVKRYVLDNPRPFIVPVTHAGDARVHGIDDPLRTVTTAQRGEHAVVTPFVAKYRGGATGQPLGEPLCTVTANSFVTRPGGAAPISLVTPFLSAYYGEGAGGDDRTAPVAEALRTQTTENRHAVVAPVLVSTAHGDGQGRGKGDYSAEDPLGTIVGSNDRAVVAPFLVPRYRERPGQEPRTRSVEEPAPVVVPAGNGAGLVAAFLAQHNEGPRPGAPGRSPAEPLSTLTATGSQQAIVSAGLLSLKGEKRRDSPVEQPARTVLAGGGHAAEIRAFLTKYYGADQDPRLEEPLHTATARDRFGLVTVEIAGEPYVIVDIGMRMLTPRELFRAQGFGDDYIIDRGHDDSGWRPLTKTAQVRMCGNSVCPPMAAALVAANYREADTAHPKPECHAPALPLMAAE